MLPSAPPQWARSRDLALGLFLHYGPSSLLRVPWLSPFLCVPQPSPTAALHLPVLSWSLHRQLRSPPGGRRD